MFQLDIFGGGRLMILRNHADFHNDILAFPSSLPINPSQWEEKQNFNPCWTVANKENPCASIMRESEREDSSLILKAEAILVPRVHAVISVDIFGCHNKKWWYKWHLVGSN